MPIVSHMALLVIIAGTLVAIAAVTYLYSADHHRRTRALRLLRLLLLRK